MAQIKHFLLRYDRIADELIGCEEYADSDVATAAYEEAEAVARAGKNLDIVLVGAESIETVKITHSNYFSGNARRLVRNALQR